MNQLQLAQQAHAVQLTLHQVLTSDLTLQAVLGDPMRVFDDAPSDPVDYPYVTYGAVRSTDTSGDSAPQSTHQLGLTVWSRYKGRSEVLDLMRQIQDVLERDTSHIVVPLYLDVVRATDGMTFRGLLRLSVTTTDQGDAP